MTDLADIFARDPLTYTKDGGELATIVEEMRKRRGQFNLGNAKAGSTKPLTAKQKEVLSIAEKLNDKGLDL